jgi:gamma-glutamylputrescine oxidase
LRDFLIPRRLATQFRIATTAAVTLTDWRILRTMPKTDVGSCRSGHSPMLLQNWWFTTLIGIREPIQPPLTGDVSCDVLIVGGGAAGLAAAARFIGTGRRVVLLERNICGGSSTGKSAGFLTPDSELELSQLVRRFGRQGAKDLWDVPVRGIELMLSRISQNGIECDLQKQDSLFLGKGKGGVKDVQEEANSRSELGYESQVYAEEEVRSVIGSSDYSAAIRYKETYGVDALRYAQGMKAVLLQNGIQVHESSEVVDFAGHTAKTHMGSVTADQVIFCADKLSPHLSAHSWNVYHEQTFLSISEPLSDQDVKALFPEEAFQCWDSDLVYSYYRLTGSKRLLLGGGSLLTTYAKNDTTTSKVIDGVISGFRKTFPRLGGLKFIQYWMGRIDMTRDLLPTVLKEPSSPWVHYVLGCVGLPWATFCGDFAARQVLAEKETGDEKYYRYFDVNRKFFIPLWMEKIIGKRAAFPLNNAWAKYRQIDVTDTKGTSRPSQATS